MENNKVTNGVNDNRHSKFDDDGDDDNVDDEETVYVIEYNEENGGENVEKGRNTDGKDAPFAFTSARK